MVGGGGGLGPESIIVTVDVSSSSVNYINNVIYPLAESK